MIHVLDIRDNHGQPQGTHDTIASSHSKWH
jgi:hypothetical protein